jgi:hypothetical protein
VWKLFSALDVGHEYLLLYEQTVKLVKFLVSNIDKTDNRVDKVFFYVV